MEREMTEEEKKQFFLDLSVIRRFHNRQKDEEQIADMLEWNLEDVELIINLIEDGFYETNIELLEAYLACNR